MFMSAQPRKASRPLTVLVADDSRDIREMLAQSLRFDGYEADKPVDGTDAMRNVLAQLPDVLVLDLTTTGPGLTEWDVAADVKADGRTKHVRIIAVSGQVLPGAEEITLRATTDAYFKKPCLPEVLAEEITCQLSDAA